MAWQLDKNHTHAQFTVRHMMVTNVKGTFEDFDVTVNFDENNPATSSADFTFKAASVNTRAADRDNHLRSADFFDAENHPNITFKSKRVEVVNPKAGRVIGDLTIRGVTHEVAFDIEYTGVNKSPFGGSLTAGFNASAKINRKDWGLVWNVAIEAGGMLVGEEVKIELEAELVKQSEAVFA